MYVLTACTELVQGGKQMNENIKYNAYEFKETVKELVTYHPPAKPVPKPLPPSYCYKVYQDIMCYREPIPGAERRLVGWQGDNVVEGVAVTPPEPVVAVPPSAQETQSAVPVPPVEASAMEEKPLSPELQARVRASGADAAKPVFVGRGPEVAGDKN